MIIPEIPDKKYFTIGQASRLLGIKPHILRYWEQEFPMLKPRKTSKGRRIYLRRDIEIAARIYDLVNIQKFTIEGARKRLTEELKEGSVTIDEGRRYALEKLRKIKKELQQLLTDIKEDKL